ncbi:hypothetical protein ACWC0C_07000 [Streptomyces sp. NPDC001709]
MLGIGKRRSKTTKVREAAALRALDKGGVWTRSAGTNPTGHKRPARWPKSQ